jgi:SAM-dependent methyltransferase
MSRLRSYAPKLIKEIVWDWKHRRSDVNPTFCPHDLLDCLSTLDQNAGLLDLGCGTGNLRAALRMLGWHGHFVGVDVSEIALCTARKSEDKNAEWLVGTIESFPIPRQKVDVVCLCESIYYARPGSIATLIDRCRHSLVPSGGRIIVRIWDADRHHEYVTHLSSLGAQSSPPIYVLHS